MKPLITACMIAAALASQTATAHPDRWVTGAVVGTAAGLIIANNTHGMNPWVAGTAGALIGGTIAGSHPRTHGYSYAPYHHGLYHDSGRWGYWPEPVVVYPRYVTTVAARPVPQRTPAPSLTPPVNLQPGVDLIKVSILNRNGVRTDVPVLRTGGQFVGPQGETYESLPDTQTLTRRYGF